MTLARSVLESATFPPLVPAGMVPDDGPYDLMPRERDLDIAAKVPLGRRTTRQRGAGAGSRRQQFRECWAWPRRSAKPRRTAAGLLNPLSRRFVTVHVLAHRIPRSGWSPPGPRPRVGPPRTNLCPSLGDEVRFLVRTGPSPAVRGPGEGVGLGSQEASAASQGRGMTRSAP